MGAHTFVTTAYTVTVCKDTGTVTGLYDHNDFPLVNLSDSGFGSLCYTLRRDDITTGTKPEMTPYTDRTGTFDRLRAAPGSMLCENTELGFSAAYTFRERSILLTAQTQNGDISQFGVNLCFAFMGKAGAPYREQLLASTPYRSADGGYLYWMLTRPNGKRVLISILDRADGWKLDYSPFSAGHFFENLKILSSFDRAYQKEQRAQRVLSVQIEFLCDAREAPGRLAEAFSVPVAHFPVSGARIGETLPVEVSGGCDYLEVRAPDGSLRRYPVPHGVAGCRLEGYGIHTATPVKDGRAGLDCRLFAFDSYRAMQQRSFARLQRPYHNDQNLCEGGVWARALCRYILLYGPNDTYATLVREHLEDVLCPDVSRAVARCGIYDKPHLNYPAYHVFESTRIQEQFSGVSFLLDAYGVFGEQRYLEYAVSSMLAMLRHYVAQSGAVIRPQTVCDQAVEDYTTVTPLVVSVVDLANVLKSKNDGRWQVFEEYALRIADFLVRRDLDFPTEGAVHPQKQAEMEDGSISCTALSVLYVCFFLRFKPEYLSFAEKVLCLHDAWTIDTPDARMYRSSLRWWETCWEGDADGPAICAGHAWTIWRGEAEFYYALLTCDTARLVDSYNAYMTNWAKNQQNGSSYSCYQPDFITGGGFTQNSADIRFREAVGFPEREDHSLSKYVWVRAADTWMKTAALIRCGSFCGGINAAVRTEGEQTLVEPQIEHMAYLYIDGFSGRVRVKCTGTLRIICRGTLRVIGGYNQLSGGNSIYVTPQGGAVLLECL